MNSNAGRDLVQEERCWPKNKSLDLWLRPWSLRNLDRLGPCNSEPFKRSKAASHRYFLKYFRDNIHRKTHLLSFFLYVKLLACEIIQEQIFHWTLLVTSSDSLTWQSYLNLDACSLILHLYVLSTLTKNFHNTLHK